MPRVFLTPLVISGLLFLPSCSNEGTSMSCEEANAKQIELRELIKESLMAASREGNIDNANDINVLKAKSFWNNRRVLVAVNSQCFTDEQVQDYTKGFGE